jgi:hypothetical protein
VVRRRDHHPLVAQERHGGERLPGRRHRPDAQHDVRDVVGERARRAPGVADGEVDGDPGYPPGERRQHRPGHVLAAAGRGQDPQPAG